MKKHLFVFYTLCFPVIISASACFSQVSMAVGSFQHSVIAGPGGVCGWGTNGVGEIGDGTITSPRSSPVAVSITGTVTKVVAGHSTTIFLKSNGTAWGCGYNDAGQLGQGNRTEQNTPVQITFGIAGITFSDIACGTNLDHVLLLRSDVGGAGKVYALGRNDNGELGTGPDGLGAYKSVATFGCPPPNSFCHACTNSGAPNSCEWNYEPTSQPLWSGVCSAIWAGEYKSFFKKTDGTIWACGYNSVGELGVGTAGNDANGDRTPPVQVTTFAANTVSKISAGERNTLFLKTDGTIWGCGWNQYGEVGDGTTTLRSTPVQGFNLGGLAGSTWSDIAAGGEYSLAVRSDAGHVGEVWGCGANGWGQLADGTTTTRTTPKQLGSPSLLAGITQVAAAATGQGNSLFYNGTTKILYSAGYNLQGQLGDGTTGNDVGCTQCRFKQVQVSTGAGCLPSILPVELISFNASCENGTVQCKWSTASEINNDYFSVERSEEGKDFIEIGKVKGAGNSSSVHNYEFTDELSNPLIHQSTIFYRLKQTDYDGRHEYYGPISVSCSSEDEWNFIFQNIIFDQELKGTLFLPEDAEINFSIVDLQGRILKNEKLYAIKGSNFIKMKLDKIDKGVYFIKLFNDKNKIVRKIVKT